MKKTTWLYILAFLITLAAASYQRITGPTYPVRGKVSLDGKSYAYRLPRSDDNVGDCPVRLPGFELSIQGDITYRRLGTGEPWQTAAMSRDQLDLIGYLPHQPTAGDLEYYVTLMSKSGLKTIRKEDPIQIRFHSRVPKIVFIPHVFFMFAAMWTSTLAGLLAWFKEPRYKRMAWVTVGLLIIGGMMLGPLMQHYAFGEYWTGVPFGYDLTDNKTLITLVCWVIAALADWKKDRRGWIIAAAIILLAVYSIPHSVLGSKLDYSTMKVKTG
jgi:hypothetical protein